MPNCKQPSCKIAQGGTCLEGQGDKCPYLIVGDQAGQVTVGASSENDTSTAVVAVVGGSGDSATERLYSGEKLSLAEATTILRKSESRVVVLAGRKDSGKTTLLARICEYYLQGPIEGYLFSQSRTLPAFGLTSWLAMAESGRTTPDTERTKHWENDTFLHLRVRHVSLSPPVEMLLSDISGETFPAAMSSEQRCRELVSLARSDHFVLFLDAATLSDIAQRHIQCSSGRDFLKMAIQIGAIGRHTIVHIVFSRWDILKQRPAAEGHEEFVNGIERNLEREFKDVCGKVIFWRIAARPKGGFMETRDEIKRLFRNWVEESYRMRPMADVYTETAKVGRDFCRFRFQLL